MLPLICIDIDGTFVGSLHRPTEAVWAAAAAAIDRGQHLALSTARGAFGQAFDWARQLDPHGWHIFHNGAALVHTGSGEVRSQALAHETVLTSENIAATNDWVIEYYTADDYIVDNDSALAVEHAGLLGVSFERRSRHALDGPIVRAQFVVPLSDAPSIVQQMAGHDATTAVATSPVMPGVAFVSCTPPGVTKAAAIAQIAALMKVEMGAVMMVGDGDNDVEAIAAVGHGVAMGNAVEAAKDAAQYTVGHVDDDGLVEALAISLNPSAS